MFTYLALVSPPVALAIDVFARSLAEIGRADDEHLEALRPGLVASPRTGRDAHRVPFLELDDLVVELHPPAPAQDHVHLLLLLVRVAVRKAIAGRDALVAQGGSLELKRLGRRAELQVRRAVEPRADVVQILLDVAERERHAAILWRHSGTLTQADRLRACFPAVVLRAVPISQCLEEVVSTSHEVRRRHRVGFADQRPLTGEFR